MKKITDISKYKTRKTNEYVLCEHGQPYEKGHHISTKININLCSDIKLFLSILHNNKEISKEEMQNTTDVYYTKQNNNQS